MKIFDFINTDPYLLIMGWTCIIVGLSFFRVPEAWKDFIDQFSKSIGLMFVCGVIATVFGLFIVTTHSVWTGASHIILTLYGYIAIIEGVVMLCLPEVMQQFVRSRFYQKILSHSGIISIAFGLVFLLL